MRKKKINYFAFYVDRKENFVARLTQLIGNRNAIAAATEWGLSPSTLHNYLTKGTEPSLTAIQNILYKEYVSLYWLAFGSICSQKAVISATEIQAVNGEEDPLEATWYMIYNSLNKMMYKN